MVLYIVRHGETEGNRAGILQGQMDLPLNEKGRRLAHRTGQALKDVRFDAVYSSPLVRALETAQILLKENHSGGVAVQCDDRLKEIAFGEWEGKGIAKGNFSVPAEEYSVFYDDPFSFPGAPGGESVREVCRRTGEFFRELTGAKENAGRTVLISTHGCAARALLHQVYEDKRDFWHGCVPNNCAVNIVEVENGTCTLVADDVIYYDPGLAVNPFAVSHPADER